MLAAAASAACNALLDNHDRQLDERDSLEGGAGGKDGATDGATPDDDAGADAEVDAPDDGPEPVTIPVPQRWKTPNGAQFTTTDAGTTITGYTSAGHPVIVPMTPPAVPSENYTVVATVRAPTNGEFGVITRVQADGSCALLGSKFGTDTRSFVGSMSSTDWSPNLVNLGPLYTFSAGARYRLKLRVAGDQATGKMWDSAQSEPEGWQTIGTIPWKTGRGVGYYVYNTYDAVLESMEITVP